MKMNEIKWTSSDHRYHLSHLLV